MVGMMIRVPMIGHVFEHIDVKYAGPELACVSEIRSKVCDAENEIVSMVDRSIMDDSYSRRKDERQR